MSNADLFEAPPFLEQKLGSRLFEDIPQEPGIYRFYDDSDTLLYVGKAKNLRRRIFTYKRARPGKTSRKEAALISKISRFEYEVLKTEQTAILKENQWIREHRPEFNHANKYTETYYFITVQKIQDGLLFGLAMNPSGELFPQREKPIYQEMDPFSADVTESKTYGCFKGHRTVRTSLGILLQLLWIAENNAISPHFLPIRLSRNLTPLRFKMPLTKIAADVDELAKMLDAWFLGDSPEFLYFLKESVDSMEESRFSTLFVEESIEILETFFQRYLERYRIMREHRIDQTSHLIHQNELDDLMTRINKKM